MDTLKELLEEYPQYREKLYIRGFLFTDAEIDDRQYPFYSAWKKMSLGGKTLLVHPLQNVYVQERGGVTMCIVGHAYNPVSMVAGEDEILTACLELAERNERDFWKYFNELTGVFTFLWSDGERINIIDDASGMQTTFYTAKDGKFYVTSHTRLIGELLDLEFDPYVKRLINYKFFRLLGNSLPGDLTQFCELKRVTPNFCCSYENGEFTSRRFFAPYGEKKSMEELADECARILHNSMRLISEKWSSPAISLTGGCDSRTTLACTNGLYDKFSYYSYNSAEDERVDCEAAETICNAVGVEHKVYQIPQEVEEEDHYDVVAKILRWNRGDLLDSHANDIRKRIALDKISDFDIEVKSWASEIGRAYFSKRFHGRTDFPEKPSGRACTTMYKFFLHDRKLVADTDKVFEKFIDEYYQQAEKNPIPWFEQFFWEFRVPAWNGLVITGEHRYAADITIPYNNRVLLTLLLSAPIEDRVSDRLYGLIRKKMNPVIDETGISITNLKHTDRRAQFENLYWVLHSKFPL